VRVYVHQDHTAVKSKASSSELGRLCGDAGRIQTPLALPEGNASGCRKNQLRDSKISDGRRIPSLACQWVFGLGSTFWLCDRAGTRSSHPSPIQEASWRPGSGAPNRDRPCGGEPCFSGNHVPTDAMQLLSDGGICTRLGDQHRHGAPR
jgi:hypothetical protein